MRLVFVFPRCKLQNSGDAFELNDIAHRSQNSLAFRIQTGYTYKLKRFLIHLGKVLVFATPHKAQEWNPWKKCLQGTRYNYPTSLVLRRAAFDCSTTPTREWEEIHNSRRLSYMDQMMQQSITCWDFTCKLLPRRYLLKDILQLWRGNCFPQSMAFSRILRRKLMLFSALFAWHVNLVPVTRA